MLDDEICKLREKLNQSIISGQDYSITYKLSVQLDDLIAQYYKELNQKKNEKREKTETKKEEKSKKNHPHLSKI